MKNFLHFIVCFFISGALAAQAHLDHRLTNLPAGTDALQVVVTFHGNDAPTLANIATLSQVGITQGATFHELPIAGVIATPAQINALAGMSSVRSIYLNREMEMENDGATALTGVDRLRTDPVLTAQNGGLPVSGQGIGVVVNDSGVDGTHPDLQFGQNLVQNVTALTNLNSLSGILPYTPVENVQNTDALGGHGTHVAGIVGGTGQASQGLYTGVAPGADLVGYGGGAAILLLDVLSAFDYAITKQFLYNIRVITNSWGTTSDSGTAFEPNDPINVATKKCTDRNIVVVFSAGNSGSASGTISGNYKKAPWVICVAAGDKQGRLADFSSRGTAGFGGSVSVGGNQFTWEDRPTVTAPGVVIISTRAISPIGVLETERDAALMAPNHLPWYTSLDGTSMAAPHVAGIVALMLDANPTLNPYQIKALLQQTATNMPGYANWEVGAGYVNAYASVNAAFGMSGYGSTLNMNRNFTSEILSSKTQESFTVEYTPGGSDQETFQVAPGTNALEVKTKVTGFLGETGNLLNLVIYSPSGTRYSAGIPVTFTLSTGRGVAVADPEPGTWILSIEGFNDVSLPETVSGTITQSVFNGTQGMQDVDGHDAETSARLAISKRLMDGKNGQFDPNGDLTRIDLADYLVMGQGVRQYIAPDGSKQFSDVSGHQSLLAESVMATGAALRDINQTDQPLLTTAGMHFQPQGTVNRAELTYAIVQSLGLQDYAASLQSGPITVEVNGETIEVEDASAIPTALRGHVQAALNLNLINVFYSLTQEPFGLGFTIHAHFQPADIVSRIEFAVIITRTFDQWQNPTTNFSIPQPSASMADLSISPNPASDWLHIRMGMIEQETNGQIILLNSSGQVLSHTQHYLVPQQRIDLDVSAYPAGSYWLQIATDNGQQYSRAVVLH